MMEQCIGCKFYFPALEEGGHRYGVASSGCWTTFIELLVQEANYFDGYPAIHRLTVDAYSIQHPPHIEIQKQLGISQRFIDASIQSIAIHLIALYAAFEKKIPLEKIAPIMDRIVSTGVVFPELEEPRTLGALSVNDIYKAQDAATYAELVTKWARLSWHAWAQHHKQIGKWYEQYIQ